MPINGPLDQENVVYPHEGILFGHEKERSIDICHNMGEPWKSYAKGKKPITKDYILYGSIYTKRLE